MSGYWEIVVGNIGDWIIVRDFGSERPPIDYNTQRSAEQRPVSVTRTYPLTTIDCEAHNKTSRRGRGKREV